MIARYDTVENNTLEAKYVSMVEEEKCIIMVT